MNTLYRDSLGLIPWITCSWFLFLVVSLLLWFSRRWGKPAPLLRRFLLAENALVAPGEVMAFLYAVATPYAAIVLGFLDPATMGLSGFDWWGTLGQGALLGAGLLLAAGLVWGVYLRLGQPPATLLGRSQRLWASPAGRLLFLPWAAGEEAHWAFYRALPMLLWGPDLGLWAGLLLIAGEHYANPQASARLRQAGGIEEEAWWWTRLLAMTAAFAVLRNLWLCAVLHALLEALVAWMVRRSAVRVALASSPLTPSPAKGKREEPAAGRQRERPGALPTIVLASTVVLALLVLFTAQAAWPQLLLRPAADAALSPVPAIPTPTPIATPHPTPPATATPTALPQPTATPTPTPPRTYVVQKGDTLKDIAAHFEVPVADLMQVNGIIDGDTLQVGQVLIIP